MAGLLKDVMDDTTKDVPTPDGTTLTQAKATGYTPDTRSVDSNETVSGQLDNVLSKDNPVMQRAKAGAMDYANSRGLVNSSMAAQAGEAAVIDAATPIAAADASTYSAAKRDNQVATNTAAQFNAGSANAATNLNTSNAADITKTQVGGKIETGLQTLKGGQATQLADIEANYKELLQASDSAARLFSTTQAGIAQIAADPNTSAEQKQAQINQLVTVLKSGMAVAGSISNIDVSGLLNFSV